ncbi:MAG: hypothetical protein ACXVLT_13090 [Flavisolibacter sp.]
MKQANLLILIAVLSLLFRPSFAQTINWKNLTPSQQHVANLNVGFDNSSTAGLGYGYHLRSKLPVLLNLEFSIPFGDKLFDDLKTKIGAQANLIHTGDFFTTLKAYSIIRRYQNDLVRIIDFGSEFSATAGIYEHRWFAAGEFGFDKAITSQLQHSSLAKEYSPGLQSGWYIPDGGNFFYGAQLGYTFHHTDLYAKLGRTVNQNWKTEATVPFYCQLGFTRRF